MMRPSPSMVVASLALFVALSGTSYAVSQLPAKSVGTQHLQRNAVTGAKVKDGSLTARDFKGGQLPAGPMGPVGPTGPAGRNASSQSGFATAARTPAYLIPSGPGFTTMFSLTEFADSATGSLDVTSPSRLILQGAVSTEANHPRFSARVTCRFEVRDAGGWRPTQGEGTLRAQPFVGSWLMVSTGVDVVSGTTDVRLVCRSDDLERVLFQRGHFSVIMTDR